MEISSLNSDNVKMNLDNNNLSKMQNLVENLSDSVNKDEIEKAARGFESMMLSMMFKGMKQAFLEEENENSDFGFGADTLLDYSDLMLADRLSQTQSGLGIARMIYKNLTGGEDLPSVKVINHTEKIKPRVSTDNHISEMIKNTVNIYRNDISSNSEERKIDNTKVYNNYIDRVNSRLSNYSDYISEASEKYDIPENLIKAIITTESAGNSQAESSAGAKGLMQLMDGTAKDLGVENSFDPYQNILGGTNYIRQMLDMFDGDLELALSAYNAGPGNVMKYDGIPPFKETQNYVVKVLKYLDLF